MPPCCISSAIVTTVVEFDLVSSVGAIYDALHADNVRSVTIEVP